MMTTYQVESIRDVQLEILPLLHDHYREIATNAHKKRLKIDWERYRGLEDAGALRIMTARKDGKLIGYLVTMVMPHLHYRETICALVDVYYVDQEHRKGRVGYDLLKIGSADLKNLGADILTMHMKTDYPFRSLLARQGFTLVEENWEKVL